MSNKSYMHRSNIITEGFFSKFAKFLKKIPKLSSDQKSNASKKLKSQIGILNKSVDKYEALVKKELGDDYPDLPRFTAFDFLEK